VPNKRFSPAQLKRARGKLTPAALGVAVGVSGQTVRNWEAGAHEPLASTLAEIARVTGKPIDFFFTRGRAA